jgi:hypothetical protein
LYHQSFNERHERMHMNDPVVMPHSIYVHDAEALIRSSRERW